MNSEEISSTNYLQELYNSSQGSIEAQVSMYDIGVNIGIEKAEAGRLAEGLMVEGYVELKTLAGGIAITNEGLIFLGFSPEIENTQEEQLTFSVGPTASESDHTLAEQLKTNIQQELSKQDLEYTTIEQIVLDLKSIELHLMSPTPKTAVILALFHSIANSFDKEDILNRTGLAAIVH